MTSLETAPRLDAEHILKFAEPIKKTCGVYVLLLDGEIVYVGQSTNCHFRIGTHFHEGKMEFDHHFIIECQEDRLDEVEAIHIAKFRPKRNLVFPRIPGEPEPIQINIRLPSAVKERLVERAQANFRSLNAEIERRLVESLAQETEKAPNA